MVTKSKRGNGKKKKIKVLNLTKETVKDLSAGESKRLKGGATGLCLSGPHVISSIASAAQSLSKVGGSGTVSGGATGVIGSTTSF